jgi:hypothetical protein
MLYIACELPVFAATVTGVIQLLSGRYVVNARARFSECPWQETLRHRQQTRRPKNRALSNKNDTQNFHYGCLHTGNIAGQQLSTPVVKRP